MAEPVRSTGAVPKRWKRRQHAERQARLERTAATGGNPVRVIPAVIIDGRTVSGPVTIVSGPTIPHGTRRTESLRHPYRWNQQDGKLLSLHADRRCSVCSRIIRAGNTAWRNPHANWWTCTRCQPVQPTDT